LSVAAVQASETLVLVTAVVCTFVGAVGGMGSFVGGVVTGSVSLGWETLPAPSRAFT
jgi:hypothetical protein